MYRHNNICFLNSYTLKIIAAISMLIDHIGYIFFPHINIFRIIGRLAFPIFSFMLSQGCLYTKNKLLYFLRIFLLAIICQIPFFIIRRELYFGILFTFSFSIIAVYSLLFFINSIGTKKIFSAVLFIFVIASIYLLNVFFEIDYGFWGCMAPVFACASYKEPDNLSSRILLFSLCLILLSLSLGGIQPYCLLSLPLLCLYSGRRGKANMKYFFYIFYPLHIVVLYGIYIIAS